jgi:hypothetical protein
MSYYPFVVAIGMSIGVVGFMDIRADIPSTDLQLPWLSLVGIVVGMWGLLGWIFEPVTEEGGH